MIRVTRGGAWTLFSLYARLLRLDRCMRRADSYRSYLGFRVARDET
jgi:hypothetical protein